MTEIITNLYIGDLEIAENETFLLHNKITHILTLCQTKPIISIKVNHLYLPLCDYGPFSETDIDQVLDFIDDGRSKGNILVHCFAGINRSPSAIIAYLMYKRDMLLSQALKFIKEKRDIIDPEEPLLQDVQNYFDNL